MSAAKLCQLVAIEKGFKASVNKELTSAHHANRDAFVGFSKVYTPKETEGETLPPESKKVQITVADVLANLKPQIARLFDIVAAKETTNAQAKADVVVDGKVLVADAPVTLLLFLEKQLNDLHTFVSKFPVLSQDQDWTWDANANLWRAQTRQTQRTKKVNRPLQLAAATDKHPAQVQLVTEDVFVGTWDATNLSGEASPAERKKILERIETLQQAVKFARESANGIDVVDKKIGQPVIDFIFGS